MRRQLTVMGMSVMAYACALVLGSLAICGSVCASEIVGEWDLQSRKRTDVQRIFEAARARYPGVKGCLLIVCDTQIWRRVDSLCSGPPGLNASIQASGDQDTHTWVLNLRSRILDRASCRRR
jgi:hypothetical protein